MTAVSQLWLGGCCEEFLTFQMEPMWPDSVGWFTFCQTWVCEAQKTASLPENVKQQWQVFAGTVLWYYFEKSWQRLTHVLRLTGRTVICIQSACSNKQHLMWFITISLKKLENKVHGCCLENKARTSGPERTCVFEATLTLNRGRGCCTGHANASKSPN